MAECSNSGSCGKSSCEGCASKGQSNPQNFMAEQNIFSDVKHVIGVVSGKGGVGKSFVTGSLANAMAAKGYKVMSINLLLPTEDTPVIWRGPVLANMVKQFWTDVVWDQIDYLFVDMPPGTGDVPLTAFQSLPIDGIVIVSSPQDLVKMIVKKAYNMAEMMKIPVLGIVENYSYVKCPDCGTPIKIFGESHIDEIAAELNVPVLGKMPIDMAYASKADSGAFDQINNEYITKAVEVMPQ